MFFLSPQTTVRRVPLADEQLIASDRKKTVQWTPELDSKAAAYSIFGNATYRAQYKLGVVEHDADRFAGSLAGNYEVMGANTANREIYHEASLVLTTVKGFKQQKAALPFILTLTGHDPITGRNIVGKRYAELSVITFFATTKR